MEIVKKVYIFTFLKSLIFFENFILIVVTVVGVGQTEVDWRWFTFFNLARLRADVLFNGVPPRIHSRRRISGLSSAMLVSNVVFFRNKILVFTLSASTKFILILNKIKHARGGGTQKEKKKEKRNREFKKEEKRGEYRHKI